MVVDVVVAVAGRLVRRPAVSVSTNGDQILILDRAHVTERQFHESLRATRSPHELDLHPFRFIHLNHSTQIATTQAVFG